MLYYSPRLLFLNALCASLCYAALPPSFTHGWDTVSNLTFAHGGNSSILPPEQFSFLSQKYKWITFADCYGGKTAGGVNNTQEYTTLAAAASLKALDPDTNVVFYWKSDMSSMLTSCSTANETWHRHPEWQLLDDKGKPVPAGTGGGIIFDSTVATFREFWQNHLTVLARALGADGKPLINGFFIDGCQQKNDTVWKNVNPIKTAAVVGNTTLMVQSTQNALDALGYNQVMIWNAMDNAFQLDNHVAASRGSMNDHFGALGAINPHTGAWVPSVLEESFTIINDPRNTQRLIQIKGWVGPLVHPREWFNNSQPTTDVGLRAAVLSELDITLSLFLMVAQENVWLGYSWFWEMSDYIPFGRNHTCPDNFFPQYDCPLGPPLGPPTNASNIYTREFTYATAYVDFNNRSASGMIWKTPKCSGYNRI